MLNCITYANISRTCCSASAKVMSNLPDFHAKVHQHDMCVRACVRAHACDRARIAVHTVLINMALLEALNDVFIHRIDFFELLYGIKQL